MTDRRLSLVLMAVMCISVMAVPVVALAVIPERVIGKIEALPWSVIAPILIPLLTGGIAAVWGFFTGPVHVAPPPALPAPVRTVTGSTKRDGYIAIDAAMVLVAVGCALALLGVR